MKKENLRKGETELYLLQENPLNLQSSNYAIRIANRTQRVDLGCETKSYVRNIRWRTVWPSIMKDINPEWVEMQVKDLSPPPSPMGHSKLDSIKRKHDKLDSDVDWTEIVEREEPPRKQKTPGGGRTLPSHSSGSPDNSICKLKRQRSREERSR